MNRLTLATSSFSCPCLVGGALALHAVFSPMALAQSSFKDLLFGYSRFADEVMVATGQIDGQFEVIGPFTPNGNYETMSAGDIDGDGSIEFVMRDAFEVSILSSSTGTSQVAEPSDIWYIDDHPFDPTFGSQVFGGDLDGDGGTDFVFNTTSDRVLVRWSSRDQDDPYETVLVPQIGDQNMIFPIEDYDGDGDLDILIYDEDSLKFIVIEGNGTNAMGAVRVIDQVYPSVADGNQPVFGQFDAEPAMDMVIHDLSDRSAGIVLGFANAGATLVDISVDEQIIPIGVEGDLDESGMTDLIVLRTEVLPSQADADVQGALFVDPLAGGSELVPMVFGVPFDGSDLFPPIQTPRLDSMDIDHDGDLDLVWMGDLIGGNGVRVTLNRDGEIGVPQFGATYIQGRPGPLHVLSADVNGDGNDEAIVTGGSNARIYDLSDGTSNIVAGSSGAFMSAMADLDGDGAQELVVVGNNTVVKVYTIAADGSTGSSTIFSNPDETTYQAVVVADFDLDGRDDLAVVNSSSGSIHFLRSIDGLTLELWARIDPVSDSFTIKPAVMDFNHDGVMDLVVGDITNDLIEFYLNMGDGSFSLANTIASSSTYWLISKDVDLDGNQDVVAVDREYLLSVFFMDANGQVDQIVQLNGVNQMVEVIAEDFVGDSLLDLSVATYGTGPVNGPPPFVWEQTSPRVFELVAALPTNSATGIAATDANNDGAMDILTVSDFDRSLMIHWGTPEACLADLTGEGIVDFFDVSAFLQAFAAQDALADFTDDGIWDFFDVSAFLQAYAKGCQ
ncbi:MAG: FG-GAP-like repeat-containing protein [Phycisphaerales bacterium]